MVEYYYSGKCDHIIQPAPQYWGNAMPSQIPAAIWSIGCIKMTRYAPATAAVPQRMLHVVVVARCILPSCWHVISWGIEINLGDWCTESKDGFKSPLHQLWPVWRWTSLSDHPLDAGAMTTSDKLARSRGQGGLRSVRGCWRLYKVMECSHRHGGGRIIDPEIWN